MTVQNFVNYVEDGDYLNTIIHRSVPGFVLQGGGFKIAGIATAQNPQNALSVIPTDPPVQNEFSRNRSNLRGTIAMAKLGTDPNSATSQWFFNLADNSANLDNQNGGFTVFGEVRSEQDFAPLRAIEALPIYNATGLFQQGALSSMPLDINPTNPIIRSDDDFVRYRNISLFNEPELAFTIVSNSNPSLVNANINSGKLNLNPSLGQTGRADITVRATSLLGETIEDTFAITIVGKPNWSLDVDGDGTIGALSDGIMAVRFLFGAAFPGDTLINRAISPNATRNEAQIRAYLQDGINRGFLDIDGNGSVNALSDGVMLVRYLSGTAFSGAALINGAIAPDATRNLLGIQDYLAGLSTIV